MRIKRPEPFTFKGGNRAVLLLHGFTGHTADVRMLGRYLESKGYTCHAPIYRGHGGSAEEIVQATAADWWTDVLHAYDSLLELGYKEIAVIGLSLGGTLGLKLSYYKDVKAVVPMCAPMFFDNEAQLKQGFFNYAKQYKQFERKSTEKIVQELAALEEDAHEVLLELGHFVDEVREEVEAISIPSLIVQARKDQMINPESANYLYEHMASHHKELKWYEEAGHVITLSNERDQLHEDIYTFLESLYWQEL